MKKSHNKFILVFCLISVLFSCDFNKQRGETIAVKPAAGGSDVDGGWVDTGDGGSGSSSDPYCTGTSVDGFADLNVIPPQVPLITWPFGVANRAPWKPGAKPQRDSSNNSEYDGIEPDFFNLSLSEAYNLLENDGPYYIRVKLNPMQSSAYNNQKYCWDRVQGAGSAYSYKKILFEVRRFVIIKDSDNNYREAGIENRVGIYEVSVDGCSPIIRIDPFPQGSSDKRVTAFSIENIETDINCQQVTEQERPDSEINAFCPFAAGPFGICTEGVIQVSTNRTHFFKGHIRSDY